MLSLEYNKRISIKAEMFRYNVDYSDYDNIFDIRFSSLSYNTTTGRQYVSRSNQKDYFGVNTAQPTFVNSDTDYQYANPVSMQPTQTSTTNSEGKLVVTKMRYAYEIQNNIGVINPNLIATAGILSFAGRNSTPIQTETFKNNIRVGLENTYYSSPTRLLRQESFLGTSTTPASFVDYLKYDNLGNVVSMVDNSGIVKSFLWAYNGQYPAVSIEGYEVPAGSENTIFNSFVGTNIITQANSLQGNMRLVSSYIYKPLIGVETTTAPNGIKTFFRYDGLGRLQDVKDTNGKIVKSYKYNYRP